LRQIAHLVLNDSVDFPEACGLIRSLLGARTELAIAGSRRYLDTTERHLLHRRAVLEWDVHNRMNVLTLRRGRSILAGPIRQTSMPGSAAQIVDYDLRRQINSAIGARNLAVVTDRNVRYELMPVHNRDEKTIARLYVEQFDAGRGAGDPAPVIVRLMALQGYRKNAEKTARVLRKHLPLVRDPSTAATMALDHASALLPRHLMVEPLTIARDEPIAEAVIRILRENLRVLTIARPGIEADLDIEFLHNFRIALRRMRSIFSAFETTFSARAVALLKPGLRWLGRETGPRRDLDVYLYGFPRLSRSVAPAHHVSLEELYRFIAVERQREQDRLVKTLGSKRYVTFTEQWSQFIDAPAIKSTAASRNVEQMAGPFIWKTYKRIQRQIRAPGITHGTEALHALRKDCKKLRYGIEAFESAYPQRKLHNAVDELKHLQDILGAVCDNSVQCSFLSERENHVMENLRNPAQLGKLLDELLAHYAVREQRMLRDIHKDLDRFSNKKIEQTYRRLFRPRNG